MACGLLEEVEDCPNGYARLAAFLVSNVEYLQFRDFGYVRTRLLLELQDKIRILEAELDGIDLKNSQGVMKDKQKLFNREFDRFKEQEGRGRTRTEIFEELRVTLKQYDENLHAMRELHAYARPSHRSYRSIRQWFKQTTPLTADEAEFVKVREELISLRPGESPTFDGRIESLLLKIDCKPVRWLSCTPGQIVKTSDPNTFYWSAERIRVFVNVLIVLLNSGLLVLPIAVLYRLTEPPGSDAQSSNVTAAPGASISALLIVILSTILFSAIMAGITSAARQEIFAASAAYCAILLVFLGNLTN